MKSTKLRVRLSLLVILSFTFIIEAIIMLLFHRIDMEGNLWLEVFSDSFLLVLFLLPSLYYFMLRPMEEEINLRQQIEWDLQAANAEAETRVVERTAELKAANSRLEIEVAERQQAEEKLQEANVKLQNGLAELERRSQEASVLTEMSDLLQACTSMEEAHRTIRHVGPRLFPASEGALYIYSPSRDDLEQVLTWGDAAQKPAAGGFEAESCWALRRGRPHLGGNLCDGLPCRNKPSTRSSFCVPLVAYGESLGVLYLSSQEEGQPSPINQSLAITTGEQIALALANLRLRETLRSQSILDPLTGVYNRRFMEETLSREVRRAERNQRELSVLIFDLDHFKKFNDTFGHEAGDALLRELGMSLKANIRGADVACRFGGEEFVLILPETTQESARERAEELRKRTRQLTVMHHGQALGIITMSVGVATYPQNGNSAEALLRAADSALYRAKSEGRDRVICAI